MKSLLKLEHISKVYQMGDMAVHALDDVSLTVEKGEFLAILGPSGSGKSTLMHIIGLLDRPDRGQVYLNGKAVSSLSDDAMAVLRNRKIGFVFQSYNLLPRLNALENTELPLIYAGLGYKERIALAKKNLSELGLGKRLFHLPSQLSGGQQQRVAIARALVNHPQIILADEPTGNLDSKAGRAVLSILSRLHRQGHTVVLVTHDLQITRAAKRVIKIKDGKIISNA